MPKDQRASHPAVKIVKMIKELYDIEDVCRPFMADARKAHRLEHGAEGMIEVLAQLVAEERAAVASSSPYCAALQYADNELPHIRNYLKHGRRSYLRVVVADQPRWPSTTGLSALTGIQA